MITMSTVKDIDTEEIQTTCGVIKWIKPNGNEIETDDDDVTIQYCESLDWKQKGKEVVKIPAKKADKK